MWEGFSLNGKALGLVKYLKLPTPSPLVHIDIPDIESFFTALNCNSLIWGEGMARVVLGKTEYFFCIASQWGEGGSGFGLGSAPWLCCVFKVLTNTCTNGDKYISKLKPNAFQNFKWRRIHLKTYTNAFQNFKWRPIHLKIQTNTF